jgi:hypothetical protein
MKKGKISIPLSSEDISKTFNGRIKVLTYTELAEYNTLDDLLAPYGVVVILYLTKKNFGHWVLLFRYPDNPSHIEFFDSYGLFPDSELKFVPSNFRKENNMKFPHLTWLLYKYLTNNPKGKIEYNNHRFQEKEEDVNTCGRHVINRYIYKDQYINDYYEMMNFVRKSTGLSYDQIVSSVI